MKLAGRLFLFWSMISGMLGAGCAAPESTSGSFIESGQVSDSPGIQTLQGQVVGTGRLIFSEPLSGLMSAEHWVLEGRFLAASSRLVIHNHFSGFNQEDGWQVHFQRRDKDIEVSVSTPGWPAEALGILENAVSDSGFFRLRLEVHHLGPARSRILIWQDRLFDAEGKWRSRDLISEQNAHLDSVTANLRFRTMGRGPRWGLYLERVSLVEAKREGPHVFPRE